jgi:hypothetical protein
MLAKSFIVWIILTIGLPAQTTVNGGRTFVGPLDTSGASLTAPNRTGSADPGTCNATKHETFYNTTTGALKLCTATNVWSAFPYWLQGLDASLPATCVLGQMYEATDTFKLYICDGANTFHSYGGVSGASLALSNLASVNVNTALLFQSGVDAGSITKPARDMYLYGSGAYGTTYHKLTGTPTGARTITFPDSTGTVLTSAAAVTVAQGGTGLAAGTSGGVPYFSGTTALTSSALLASGKAVFGGGAGAAPTTANPLTVSGNDLTWGDGGGTTHLFINGAGSSTTASIFFQYVGGNKFEWRYTQGSGAFWGVNSNLGNIWLSVEEANNRATFGGAVVNTVNAVAFSATPAFNMLLGNVQKITLTANVTSSTATNLTSGQRTEFLICQDSAGSRTFVWPTNVKGGMTVGPTLSTCSAQAFLSDGTNLYALAAGVANQ